MAKNKTIYSIFLKGLILVLPVTLTISLISWAVVRVEGIFGNILSKLLGHFYVPGIGILASLLIVFLAGLLVSNYITERFVKYFLSKFEKVPFIKTVYNPLKDLFALFGSGGANKNMQSVVLVRPVGSPLSFIGLVTREDFPDLPDNALPDNHIAVYVPMSYMFGGFTTIVSRDAVTAIDIPVEKAMKLAITGWITEK
ncbi:DUF502 domain-containing protein [Bacteriovoracaceae bacterium]|nr:DUF502 domain-containing protein [Bacteriovoracaceae bacterium]